MGIINPNLADVVDYSVPITPGTYRAKVDAAKPGTSSKGNAKVEAHLSVDVDGKPYKRQSHMGLNSFLIGQFARACGQDEAAAAWAKGESYPIDTDVFVGCDVMVVIEADEYNGKPSDKINGYLKP